MNRNECLICNLHEQTSRHTPPVLNVVAGEARREYSESRSNPPAVPMFAEESAQLACDRYNGRVDVTQCPDLIRSTDSSHKDMKGSRSLDSERHSFL
ncbi:hypothetical protein Y032_0078g1222 [Ancylostoma ceylanicum]|uniref:Uncharacterized protein n=1 Tax=Ancylostoma ceylanicum TaxID=53326 RepID=A0A016TT27_9BILA|nr:hypothetical protein Y032_0078g1222 [Ancylostoma ceylanicum]